MKSEIWNISSVVTPGPNAVLTCIGECKSMHSCIHNNDIVVNRLFIHEKMRLEVFRSIAIGQSRIRRG